MAVAAAAIVVAVTGLCLWARHFAGYHHGTIPGIYLALVVAATTVTTVSAARGTRAALARRSPARLSQHDGPFGLRAVGTRRKEWR